MSDQNEQVIRVGSAKNELLAEAAIRGNELDIIFCPTGRLPDVEYVAVCRNLIVHTWLIKQFKGTNTGNNHSNHYPRAIILLAKEYIEKQLGVTLEY